MTGKKIMILSLFAVMCAGLLVFYANKEKEKGASELEKAKSAEKSDISNMAVGSSVVVEITIGYTIGRVDDFFEQFSIKISGKGTARIEEIFTRMINAKSMKDMEDDLEFIRSFANDLDDSSASQLLVFVASFYVRMLAYEEAVSVLENVVLKNDPVWSSFAKCITGVIYEKYLHDKDGAYKAYSSVLLDYPDSLEVAFANRALQAKE